MYVNPADINGKGKGSVRKLALRSGPRSRNDIEAQRELHRELLEDSSEESESNGRDDEMEQGRVRHLKLHM